MDLECSKCNQKYFIPDYKLTEKQSYFLCEKCGHKIVINQEGENWFTYKGLTRVPLSAKDILEGLFFSFNLKNVLLSFSILFFFVLFLFLTASIVYNNIDFFSKHINLSWILAFSITSLLLFIYDVHLYLLSKNSFHRIRNGKNIKFSMIKSEIFNDLKPIFILSIGVLLAYLVLLIPIISMGKPGFIYAGIFHPIFLLLAVIFIFIHSTKNIIYAFIASISRKMKYTLKGILRFIIVENINIPIYLALKNIISNIFYSIIIFFLLAGLFCTGLLLFQFIGPDAFYGTSRIFSTDPSVFLSNLFSPYFDVSLSIKFGVMLFLFFTFIVLLLSFAYYINLKQTLSVVSVYIMESNPGKSISKIAVITILTSIFMLSIITISAIFLFI